ncbi:hypothetical protein [Methylobacterium platani]|uniref:Uncharacterized protein n=2 Tax=Methylobacterium platani TaxID=427683 RepID=A0A179SAD4_9HYPH|nr:hypothetical protein [Methylobacterium platani]KMO16171.1 hypothetical protein SQ03_15250 [Methylobacterium platani JCM 14648]OAS24724.1 hypothetical protein A5481_13425 [Methylobacterium platani]
MEVPIGAAVEQPAIGVTILSMSPTMGALGKSSIVRRNGSSSAKPGSSVASIRARAACLTESIHRAFEAAFA